MAHFNFVISQNAKWGHAGFYIDCHRMTVPENILLQKSTGRYGSIPLFVTTTRIIYVHVIVRAYAGSGVAACSACWRAQLLQLISDRRTRTAESATLDMIGYTQRDGSRPVTTAWRSSW